MGGARSRAKGHEWERIVAHDHTRVTGHEWKRNLTEVREGSSRDVLCEGGAVPLALECKSGKVPRILAALDQARDAAPEGHIPVALIRIDGSRWRPTVKVVLLDYEDYLEFVRLRTQAGDW